MLAILIIGGILTIIALWLLPPLVLRWNWRPQPKVFLSYRKTDTKDMTDRLYDDLTRELGAGRVFKDNREIPPAEPWPDEIKQRLADSDIVVVMIGQNWPMLRLNDPNDWVRRKIETGFALYKPILPVLVNQAVLQN